MVSEIGMMNIGETLGGKQGVNYIMNGPNGSTIREHEELYGLGANSVQQLTANKSNVKKVKVHLSGPGAITSLTFCPVDC